MPNYTMFPSFKDLTYHDSIPNARCSFRICQVTPSHGKTQLLLLLAGSKTKGGAFFHVPNQRELMPELDALGSWTNLFG